MISEQFIKDLFVRRMEKKEKRLNINSSFHVTILLQCVKFNLIILKRL